MLVRSGKMQFLFWAAFFAVILYLWIMTVGIQTFVLPEESPMELPQNIVTLMFMLYMLLTIDLMIGLIMATMIDNRYYQKFFGVFIVIAFVSVVGAKSLFG
jgi:hypothetical protein